MAPKSHGTGKRKGPPAGGAVEPASAEVKQQISHVAAAEDVTGGHVPAGSSKAVELAAFQHEGASMIRSLENTSSQGDVEQLYTLAMESTADKERSLLKEVHTLGHYPKRAKNPDSSAKNESNLRKRLDKMKASLSKESLSYLKALASVNEEEMEMARRRRAQDLIESLRAFGRMPRKIRNPETKAEKDEQKLARDICEARAATAFSESEEMEITQFAQEADPGQKGVQDLLSRVRLLGRMPSEMKHPVSVDEKAEQKLARDLREARAAKALTEAEEVEMSRLAQEAHPAREHVQGLLSSLRELGRIPLEIKNPQGMVEERGRNLARELREARASHSLGEDEEAELTQIAQAELTAIIWAAYEAEGEEMSKLYSAATALIRKGVELQSPYDQQLMEEIHWRVVRVSEAQSAAQYVKKWAEEEYDRKAALKEVKATIEAVQSSSIRCCCHDFWHWRHLWRVDPSSARRLRESGHHLPHCTLAVLHGIGASLVQPTTDPSEMLQLLWRAPASSAVMLVVSCTSRWDSCGARICGEPASKDEVLVHMCLAEEAVEPDVAAEHVPEPSQCFFGCGVFSRCQFCGCMIEAGIFYHGCCFQGDGTWVAACSELTFHHFGSECNPGEVLDGEASAHHFPGFISRRWGDSAINPMSGLPGQ